MQSVGISHEINSQYRLPISLNINESWRDEKRDENLAVKQRKKKTEVKIAVVT